MHEHPTVAHYGATGDGSALTISDFISDRQFRSTGLYADSYRLSGLNYTMTFALTLGRERIVGGTVNRVLSDFSDRERACIGALRPHVVQAFQAAQRFEQLQAQLGAAQARAGNGAANDGLMSPPAVGPAGRTPLTARETEVLYWVACGKTNEEIGRILGTAETTVKKHLQNVFDKLGVSNRAAAAVFVTAVHPELRRPG